MLIVDTHAHLDFPQFDADRSEIIDDLDKHEIGLINISTSLESIPTVIKLATDNPSIWGMIGLHPTDIATETILKIPNLVKEWSDILDVNPKIVGVGEIGLDYFHDRSTEAASRQKGALKQFLMLAKEKNKPVSFHCRDAYGDLTTILQDYRPIKGVIHCFSGSAEQAKTFLQMGLLLSFTAIITYPKNEELREIVKSTPLEKIMVETDSPFLPPSELRGQRNDPRQVTAVAQKIAQIKGIAYEEVATQTTKNAIEFFGLE